MKLLDIVSFVALTALAAACNAPRDPGEIGQGELDPVAQAEEALDTPPCQALKSSGVTGDGEYTVTVSGHTMSIYCHGMSGTPREYLTLKRTSPGRNVSRSGSTLTTTFTKVRLDTQTLQVDANDFTFATSVGSAWFGSSVGWGIAADCVDRGSQSGVANVDLSGTPFAVADSQFLTNGYAPAGSITYYGMNQDVDLTGGGLCGWTGPTTCWSGPTSPALVQLEWIGSGATLPKSCAEVRANNPSAGDTEYTLDVSGQPVSIYCYDMAHTPFEYLTLHATGTNQNFSSYVPGPGVNGYQLNFSKIRFHPDTLIVDWQDTRFSTVSGSGSAFAGMGYGFAGACRGEYDPIGLANVDLSGTIFGLANNQLVPWGWHTTAIMGAGDMNDQVKLFSGGGYCGGMGPVSDKLLLALSVPSSCYQYKALHPSTPDGEVTLYAGGNFHRAFSAYCDGMATATPATYLTLPSTTPGANVSRIMAGGVYSGTDLVTTYTKTAIDAYHMYAGTGTRFRSSTGHVNEASWSNAPYAYAEACVGVGVAAGTANVDLTGTHFGVAPNTFITDGWKPAGSTTYSHNNQVVAITGGGYCGYTQLADWKMNLTWIPVP